VIRLIISRYLPAGFGEDEILRQAMGGPPAVSADGIEALVPKLVEKIHPMIRWEVEYERLPAVIVGWTYNHDEFYRMTVYNGLGFRVIGLQMPESGRRNAPAIAEVLKTTPKKIGYEVGA
jgi:hypothetical protein